VSERLVSSRRVYVAVEAVQWVWGGKESVIGESSQRRRESLNGDVDDGMAESEWFWRRCVTSLLKSLNTRPDQNAFQRVAGLTTTYSEWQIFTRHTNHTNIKSTSVIADIILPATPHTAVA
jgi:hypothetical protein